MTESMGGPTTPGSRSAPCSPGSNHVPHTPKRRKLNTPRSKPITGFFARQKAAESSQPKPKEPNSALNT